jgi:hypothetical protein
MRVESGGLALGLRDRMELLPCCCAVWFLGVGVIVIIVREFFARRERRDEEG